MTTQTRGTGTSEQNTSKTQSSNGGAGSNTAASSSTPLSSKASSNPSSTSNSNDRSEPATQGGMNVKRSDRERPVESTRENGRRTGSNMQRYGGTSPVLGGTVSPFVTMRRMAEEMDRMFEQFGFPRTGISLSPRFDSWLNDDLWGGGSESTTPALWSPQIDSFRRGDRLVVRADIPGVQKDDVHVEVENDVLTIRGERHDEHEEERNGYSRSERSYGQFYRAIPLPEGIDAEKCEASFKDGVLEVSLPAPKQDERKARRIQIR